MLSTKRGRDDGGSPRTNEHGHGDKRGAARVTLLIRAAKITHPDGEFLCVVHNVSETGVRLRLFHPLPVRSDLILELPNGDRHAIEWVWEEHGRAGFRFREPQDVARLVACPSDFPRRPVRVGAKVLCTLVLEGRRGRGFLCNVSQHGAMIRSAERLSLYERLSLGIPGTREIAARVCWRRGDRHGLSFEDTIEYAELAAIVFRLHGWTAQNDRRRVELTGL